MIITKNNNAKIGRMLNVTDRELRGTTLGYDIGKTLREALLTINPAKKRKLKDGNFGTKVGLVITESDIVAAAEKRDESKKRGPSPGQLRSTFMERRTLNGSLWSIAAVFLSTCCNLRRLADCCCLHNAMQCMVFYSFTLLGL